MQEIGKLVRDILGEAGMNDASKLADIKGIWPSLSVGAWYAEPYRLEDGILFVKVKSHAWAQELRYKAGEIVDEIGRRKGIEITGINIKVNLK